jgi:6-phosphogluconate dehydrogenase
MRQISARKAERVEAAKKFDPGTVPNMEFPEDFRDASVQLSRVSLHAAFVITYAQGLSLLKTASVEKKYEIDLVEVAKIWRGGCIIRAALLEDIRKAFEAEPDLVNLILSDVFLPDLQAKLGSLKMVVNISQMAGVPCMSGAAALNYLIAYTRERLPANLIQAQRDYFGAHTYQRIDKEGIFHTPDWSVAD